MVRAMGLMVRVLRVASPESSGLEGFATAWPLPLPGLGSGSGCGPRFFGSALPHIHMFIWSIRAAIRYWSSVHAAGVSSFCQIREPAGRFAANAAVSNGSSS